MQGEVVSGEGMGNLSFPIASMVAEMQSHFRGKDEGVDIVLKRPASAVSEGEGDEAKPKGAKSASSGTPFVLGCSKCRGSPQGCTQCQDPAFRGRRFTRD